MKLLLLFLYTLSYEVLIAQENWRSKKPIIEYRDSIMIRDGTVIYNHYYVLETPPKPKDYGLSIEYSINQLHPFSKIHHISKIGNEVIYDVYYEGADFGLRKIPANLINQKATTHLIIAGDSNTFGDGVSVEETLPVLLSQSIPNTRPYNWGIRGGGPNNTLAMMEFLPWERVINEKKGIFIYNYYDFLIERVIGFKNYILWTKGITPYYKLNDEGIATYQGNFKDRFLTKIFQLMNSFQWTMEIFPTLPRPRYEHSVILAKVFLKMHEEYKKKFPEGQFIVAINYNFHRPLGGRLEDLQKELTKNKVSFIVVPPETYDDEYLFQDLHLNSRGHRLEAELLLKVLPFNKIAR